MSNSSTAMSTFHPFPRLPAELRNTIWELNLDPREVTIKANRQTEMIGENLNFTVYFSSPTAIPSALQACRDSRSLLAERHYSRAFSNGTSPHYVWVAFALDTIRINDVDLPHLIRLPDPLAIRYLTVDCPAHSVHASTDPGFLKCRSVLLATSTLQRLSVVCERGIASAATGPVCSQKWIPFFETVPGPGPTGASPHWTMRFADTDDMTATDWAWLERPSWKTANTYRHINPMSMAWPR